MSNLRIVTKMANPLGADTRTTLGRHWNNFSQPKRRLKHVQ